jgi:ankyrin repeat protein
MKYIKLFEEHSYSVYDLITMSPYKVIDLLMSEIQKENPELELIKDILEYSVVDINSKDSIGQTALMLAANWGNEKCVELLLNHPGIDVNLQDKWGWTALMNAVDRKVKVVELLLNHPGIDITLEETESSRTAWDIAFPYIREKFPQLNPNFR